MKDPIETIQAEIRALVPGLPADCADFVPTDCAECGAAGAGRLKMDAESIMFKCEACEFITSFRTGKHKLGGRFEKLLEQWGITEQRLHSIKMEVMYDPELYRVSDISGLHVPKFRAIELPEGSRRLRESDDHFEYLKSRGIPDPLNLDVYVTDVAAKGFLEKRVIIPYRDRDGKVIAWNGRIIDDSLDAARYYLESQSNAIYGIDRIYDRTAAGPLFVVEGEFDAIMLNGVAVGSHCSDINARTINECGNRRVIVVPDNDSAGRKLNYAAYRYGWLVAFVPDDWGCKDAADACRQRGIEAVTEYLANNHSGGMPPA